ncbi:MAG: hypothetical protein NVS9B15_16070 [Acidobacteriaceae bacterium]
MTLSFPPFTTAVKWLLGINTAVYILALLTGANTQTDRLIDYFVLLPIAVVQHGMVWQLFTYAFIHLTFWHWFGNMLALWMFGSQLEQTWGTQRFSELFAISAVGASLITVLLAYAHVLGDPGTITYGASGGVFGILMAFGMLFAESEIMLFPLPFQIKAKYFIGVLIVVEVIFAIQGRSSGGGGIAYVAHLGGLLFGWLYVKYSPRYGLLTGSSERMYGIRNSYYRWKRRRAAKKFQVYMKKQGRDVPYFDEYGNYRPPSKDDDRKGPWVN